MKIQYLNGGLANQVFQYIFVRFAELYNPQEEPWFIDDSFFFVNNVHNGYELEKVFGIQANLLSRHFDSDVWDEFIRNKQKGISIAQSFKNLGFDIQMIAETDNYRTHNPFDGKVFLIYANEFHPEITRLPLPNTYYHGYWINKKWFEAYRDILKQELAFPPITDSLNQRYAGKILSSDSIGIHIRRGDYVSLGWDLNSSYYLQSMQMLTRQHPDAEFFVFSDDLSWCRQHASMLGFDLTDKITYVDGNRGEQSFRDLQLMSMCRGLLMSNSAFCLLAVLLNEQLAYCIQPKDINQ